MVISRVCKVSLATAAAPRCFPKTSHAVSPGALLILALFEEVPRHSLFGPFERRLHESLRRDSGGNCSGPIDLRVKMSCFLINRSHHCWERN